MVAASTTRSQVPPYDLQAPPVLVLRAIATNQLRESAAVMRLESKPGDSGQDNAARPQRCRHPTPIRNQHRRGPVVQQANAPATLESLHNQGQISAIKNKPGECHANTPIRRNWKGDYEHNADGRGRYAGAKDNAPEKRVRCEFGRVCVRRHA